MRRALFMLGMSLLASFSALTGLQAATIRISAPRVELALSPGETYSGEIVTENPTDEETKVKIYLEDWIYTPGGTGEKKFTPASTTPLSASSWITFSPAEDVIKPFGRTTVRYTVVVPPNAKGGHYAVLFFETLLGTVTEEEGVNVLVAGRVGALFFIETKNVTERSGKIEAVDITPPAGNKPMEILTRFRNTGNVDISVGGKYLVMDPEGKVQARGDLNKIYTFPGAMESGNTQVVGRLAKGAYQLLLTYDLGKGKSLVEEKSITVE